jgi:hypothetical protein
MKGFETIKGFFKNKFKNLKPINVSVNINLSFDGLKKDLSKAWSGIRKKISYFWKNYRTRVYIVIGAIIIYVIGMWLLQTLYIQQPKIPTPKEGSLPPVTTENLTLTDLSQIIELFGPWDSPTIQNGQPVTNSKALVLLQEDGGMKISRLGINFPNKNWEIKKPPEIASMTLGKGTVKIMTNKSRIFTLAIFQPFILEQRPQMVYLIDDGGKIWGLTVEQTSELKYEIK